MPVFSTTHKDLSFGKSGAVAGRSLRAAWSLDQVPPFLAPTRSMDCTHFYPWRKPSEHPGMRTCWGRRARTAHEAYITCTALASRDAERMFSISRNQRHQDQFRLLCAPFLILYLGTKLPPDFSPRPFLLQDTISLVSLSRNTTKDTTRTESSPCVNFRHR